MSSAVIKKSLRGSFVYCCCSVLVGSGLLILSRNVSWFGEWYASYIFPVFPDTVGRLMSLLPFSFFEVLICVAGVFAVAYIIYLLILLIVPKLRRGLKKALTRALLALLVLSCTLFMVSSLTCTVNYGRSSFADLSGRQIPSASKEDLLALCEFLINDINLLSEEIATDKNKVFTYGGLDIKNGAREAMKNLGRETEALAGYYPNPKPIYFSKFMSQLGLTGIYSPFTIEANYNNDVPEYVILYTMCHELAHLKGFMREDEAGFIAYLACRGSEAPEFKYSGALSALSYALNAYYSAATPEEYVALRGTLPEQAVRDMLENKEYWRGFQGKVSEIADRANDIYLKANAQKDGVKSYGRMVDLLLAEYRLGVV